MKAVLGKEDYLDYFSRVLKKLEQEKDYVTELDAATGDGDHWANMYTGFKKLTDSAEDLRKENLSGLMKRCGMLLMSGIGGSSGVLYGGAYISVSKALEGTEEIDLETFYNILKAMLESIISRGGARPGHKTMIDALDPAVNVLRRLLDENQPECEVLEAVKEASREGADATRSMRAVFGRAVYQADKGEGHLDPGAVTMYYQIEILADMFLEKLK